MTAHTTEPHSILPPSATTPSRRASNPFRSTALWLCVLVLTGSAIALPATIASLRIRIDKLPIYPQEGLTVESIPAETESFVRIGVDIREQADVETVLGTKNYVTRTYIERTPRPGTNPRAIQFHAAYYTGTIDTVPHVPDRCFVGGGLQVGDLLGELPVPLDMARLRPGRDLPARLEGRIREVRLSNQFSTAPGRFVRLPKDVEQLRMRTMRFIGDGQTLYAGYFFIANGGHTPIPENIRLLAFNHRDNYAYYLKVQFTSSSVSSGEELAELAARFLDDQFGEIMRCVPDWVQVEEGLYPADNPKRPDAPSES